MRDPSRLFVRTSFGVAVLAAIGFGASQALAGPPRAPAPPARLCDPVYCDEWCQSQGHMFGRCRSGMGSCICDPYLIEE